MNQKRENNHNWRGGKLIDRRGYILIHVGKLHPLADKDGYAYEHRIVASKMIGRFLKPEEDVHHKNRIKSDNDPSNLKVYSSRAEHVSNHRSTSSKRKKFQDQNILIKCACGCEKELLNYDKKNRPRRFIHGHQWTVRWGNSNGTLSRMRK